MGKRTVFSTFLVSTGQIDDHRQKVEEIIEGGKTTYEVLLVTGDKKTIEVVVDPTGKIVKEEKKEEKKEQNKE